MTSFKLFTKYEKSYLKIPYLSFVFYLKCILTEFLHLNWPIYQFLLNALKISKGSVSLQIA